MKMAKKKNIVKYANSINEVQFNGLDAAELNVLFSIFSVIKDKQGKQVLPFNEFRKMTGIKTKDKQRFVEYVRNTYKKILSICCEFEDDESIELFTVVNRVYVDKKMEYVEIEPNEAFIKYFSDVLTQYTIFELKDITELESKYAKNLYRLLIQFRSTGYCYLTFEQLKKGLDISDTYTTNNILKRCILPSVKEITEKEKIENLKYKAIYDESKKGQPVKAYEFTFTPKASNIIDGQMAFDFVNNRLVTQRVDKKPHGFTQRSYDYEELEKLLIEEGRTKK